MPSPAVSIALFGAIASPRVKVSIASRNCRAPDWATPSAMMRSTLRGSARARAWARATAPVSASERYSTPAGERYWTVWAPESSHRDADGERDERLYPHRPFLTKETQTNKRHSRGGAEQRRT